MNDFRSSPRSEESPSDEMLPKEAEEEDRRLLLDKGRGAMGEKDDEKEEEGEEGEDQHKPRKMASMVARTILMAVTDLCCVRIYHFLKHIAYLT